MKSYFLNWFLQKRMILNETKTVFYISGNAYLLNFLLSECQKLNQKSIDIIKKILQMLIFNKEFLMINQTNLKNDISGVEERGEEANKTFEDLGLKKELLRGLYNYGFEEPSEIQRISVRPMISKRDMIVQAQSGVGKTAAFSIGSLEIIDQNSPHCQILIMQPTRQLALQTKNVISAFSQYMKIKVLCCIGGVQAKVDRLKLKQGGYQVVVGTPGRIMDLIQRNSLKTDYLKAIIVDEADQMLKRSFLDAMKQIFGQLPSDIQVCLFSATIPECILQMTEKFMKDPFKILVQREKLTVQGIKQFYIAMKEQNQKLGTLIMLYKHLTISQCIVFTSKKEKAIQLAKSLREHKFVVSLIHGDLETSQRFEVMRQFRRGDTRILIATDIVGRGIDIQHVNLVINYDMPNEPQQYLHRIGRSGRFGRKGVAINFITPFDARFLVQLRQVYQTSIQELPLDLTLIEKSMYDKQ